MAGVDIVIFHQPPRDDDASLVRSLAEARARLLEHQSRLFLRAGADRVLIVPGREEAPSGGPAGESFGTRLKRLVREERLTRFVVLGSGAVPRMRASDAQRLVSVALGNGRKALTNNRYSSDVCAISDAEALRALPALPSDNALPRWLEERAGFTVTELAGRERLALDLDTPLDLALLCLTQRMPGGLRELADEQDLHIPNLDALRRLARDPRRELLVFGRSGSTTLRWLERNVRCRVRFLAEERGLRASSSLAIGGEAAAAGRPVRPPRATLGRLTAARGPAAFGAIVAQLSDGAIVDSRVLMADRWGADERSWPSTADRFASDLFRADRVTDPWLRDLTRSAADASIPIVLGAHTLVGPGVSLLLGGT